MKLSIGFSPCPNDTFIFDALVNERIVNNELSFKPIITDVEALNKMAQLGELDITKISMAAYPGISDKYLLLNCGSAIGNNNGPLLVSKNKIPVNEIDNLRIAIPGFNTTANLLLSIAFPKAIDKKEYLFSQIEDAVIHEKTDAGLIIHESRFTYKQKGLQKIIDLGQYWEETFQQLIPLGGIAIKRDLPEDVISSVNKLIGQSVTYAFAYPLQSENYIKKHSQALAPEIIQQHIKLYVNEYSINLGSKGHEAIRFLFEKGKQLGLLPEIKKDIFAK